MTATWRFHAANGHAVGTLGLLRMPDTVVIRKGVTRAISDFLDLASAEPASLVLEGEAGIGKSTEWLAAAQTARERGFHVMTSRAAVAESVLAYGALADLLDGVDAAMLAGLPEPQRRAVDIIASRADAKLIATDQHAVCAAFLAIVEILAEEQPVLVAIDDMQWLDPSSTHAVAFAARRLVGRVGLLSTVRTDSDGGPALPLQLPRPETTRRIRVPPLTTGALHEVVSARLGRTFSRPTMLRIHEVSGGNPFYALELA
jgi:hypothetical protein